MTSCNNFGPMPIPRGRTCHGLHWPTHQRVEAESEADAFALLRGEGETEAANLAPKVTCVPGNRMDFLEHDRTMNATHTSHEYVK